MEGTPEAMEAAGARGGWSGRSVRHDRILAQKWVKIPARRSSRMELRRASGLNRWPVNLLETTRRNLPCFRRNAGLELKMK
jgi:hypothetical protein